jgi:hypothetical protein
VTVPCPECGSTRTRTIRTRVLRNGTRLRRHECRNCVHRWSTTTGPIPERLPRKPPTRVYNRLSLTENDVITILESPERDADLATRYGCSRQSIVNIRLGRTLAHVRPDIPRRRSQRAPLPADAPLCTSCMHWSGTDCGFGFPEAVTEPTFALECSQHRRITS